MFKIIEIKSGWISENQPIDQGADDSRLGYHKIFSEDLFLHDI